MKPNYVDDNYAALRVPYLKGRSIAGNSVKTEGSDADIKESSKDFKLNTQKRIVIAFTAIIMALMLIGSTSIYFLQSIATATDKLFKHPFLVSNAVREINLHIILMENSMKDVVLSDKREMLSTEINKLNTSEHYVLENFKLIYKRFLGDKKLVDDAYNAMLAWRPIRERQIQLLIDGDAQAARIIFRTEDEKHVSLLIQSTQVLLDYALNKAEEFRLSSASFRKEAFGIVVLLFILSTTGSVFIAYYVVKKLILSDKDAIQYLNLIDQNILIATFDKERKVQDISSSLCRFLRCAKNSFDGDNTNFFIGDSNNGLVSEINLTIQTGKVWRGEYQLEDNEGELKWVRSEIYPVFDESFLISGYRNIITDIGDKKGLEAMSYTDKLTSLYNRRYFDEVIKKEIKLAKRNNAEITLAILDVDYFKQYNDRYGHPAGDFVLSEIAHVLTGMMRRPNDYVFRLGGEEFGILFTGIKEEESYHFLEKIRAGIEERKIEHMDSSVSEFISISIGAKAYQGDAIPSAHQFYVDADKALYDAKRHRNTVVLKK